MRTRSGLLICAVLSVAVAANVLSAQTAWMSNTPASQQSLGSAAEGVACSRDGAYVGIATTRGLILKRGDQTVIDQPVGHLYSVDISPDGRLLAGGGRDGTIRVWDVDSREVVKTLRGHRATVSSVRFSPDGKRMASGSWDGSVILWDTETWTSVRTLSGHTDEVYAVAFSPDGAHLTSGGWDRTVRVWTWTGEMVTTLTLDAGVMAIAFSPDGKHMAAGAYDGVVKLWSVGSSWAEETVPKEVQSPVRSLIFSPDGYLVSGHEDGGLRVLSVPAGRTVMVVPSRGAAVTGLSFNSAKRILISVARDGQFAFWITSPPPPPPPTPPTIQITSPAQSPFTTQDASIVVAGIVTDDSGVKDIMINDVSLFGTGERGVIVVPRETDRSIPFNKTIPLQVGENRITVAAQDDAGAWAVPKIIVVTYRPPLDGKYYALIIAVQEYQDPNFNNLDYPLQDAQRLIKVLTTNYTFEEKNIRFLQNPDRRTIIQTFSEMRNKITETDNLLIFYAGHGNWDEGLQQGFWLPSNAGGATDPSEWLPNSTVRDYIRGIKTRHTLLIADACFSGGIFRTREPFLSADIAIQEIYRVHSRRAITSGALRTVPDRSVFMEYLMKKLHENTSKFLTAQKVYVSIKEAVINNSPNQQTPLYGIIQEAGDEGAGDFIFVRR